MHAWDWMSLATTARSIGIGLCVATPRTTAGDPWCSSRRRRRIAKPAARRVHVVRPAGFSGQVIAFNGRYRVLSWGCTGRLLLSAWRRELAGRGPTVRQLAGFVPAPLNSLRARLFGNGARHHIHSAILGTHPWTICFDNNNIAHRRPTWVLFSLPKKPKSF